jgi:CHRD domain
MHKSIWFTALLVPALSACMSATPSATSFSASLSGASEVPPNASTGTGSATATLKGTNLTIDGSYSGLTGAATVGHIHGPAAKGTNAPVLFDLMPVNDATPGSGKFSKSFTLTDAQVADLKAGNYYVNVHTAANAGGEVRGQLEAK